MQQHGEPVAAQRHYPVRDPKPDAELAGVRVSLDAEQQETGSKFREILPDLKPGPVESLDSAERADAVREAVAALPEEMRTPLVLFTYEEKSHAEIAEILNCSPKAVEMRLYHARNQLRDRLQGLLV